MEIDFGGHATRSKRLTIYLPDRDCNGHPIEQPERWTTEAQLLFTTLFGGCTTFVGTGMWHDKVSGTFIEEATTIVSSFVDPIEAKKYEDTIRAFIRSFLKETNQEAVAVEYDGSLYFIYNSPALVSI